MKKKIIFTKLSNKFYFDKRNVINQEVYKISNAPLVYIWVHIDTTWHTKELMTSPQPPSPTHTHSEGQDSQSCLGLVLNFGTCLVSDENFWDSLVPVSSRWFHFYLVSSRSRPDLDE